MRNPADGVNTSLDNCRQALFPSWRQASQGEGRNRKVGPVSRFAIVRLAVALAALLAVAVFAGVDPWGPW